MASKTCKSNSRKIDKLPNTQLIQLLPKELLIQNQSQTVATSVHQNHQPSPTSPESESPGLTIEQREKILQQRKYYQNRKGSSKKINVDSNAKSAPSGITKLKQNVGNGGSASGSDQNSLLLEMMKAKAKTSHTECEQRLQQKDAMLQTLMTKLRSANETIQKQASTINQLQEKLKASANLAEEKKLKKILKPASSSSSSSSSSSEEDWEAEEKKNKLRAQIEDQRQIQLENRNRRSSPPPRPSNPIGLSSLSAALGNNPLLAKLLNGRQRHNASSSSSAGPSGLLPLGLDI